MWKSLLGATILALSAFGVRAASGDVGPYPSKPIRIVLGFAPGGTDDFLARVVGPKLTERFGQPVIVDNRPGAGTNLGAEITSRANPDGYTVMLGPISALATSRTLYPKLGYDMLKDFSYISLVATGAQVLVANPSVPAKSVSELVALARSKPNAIRYGSAGVASSSHLAMEMLRSRTGIELLHVPYKSGSLVSLALTGGEVDITFSGVQSLLSMIKAKRLNALAVSSPKRVGALPEVPTVAESGVPGFDANPHYGIIAPIRTPAAIVKLLNAEIRSIVQMEDVRAKLAAQALEATGSTPDEFRAMAQAEIAKWARVIKDANITIN